MGKGGRGLTFLVAGLLLGGVMRGEERGGVSVTFLFFFSILGHGMAYFSFSGYGQRQTIRKLRLGR